MTRVERAWLKYQLATTPARKDRWQFAYLAAMSADKAIKAVEKVRTRPDLRDGSDRARRVTESSVVAISKSNITTVFVDRSNRGPA